MSQIAVEMTGDEGKLFRSLENVIKQQKRLEDKFRDVAASARQAGQQGEQAGNRIKDSGDKAGKAFGQQALTSLTRYAAGVVSMTAAVNLLKAAWEGVDQAREKAMETQTAAEMGMTQLAQLSGGDPAKYRSLTRQARQLYGAGGAASLDQAARTIFSLASAGAMGALPLFRDLYGIVESPDVFARAATTLKTSMGQAETGDLRAIASKAFAASAFSPATAETLLESAARAGPTAKGLGIRDESVLAATALLATATGSAELGGTQLASLLRALLKGGEYDVPTGRFDANYKEIMQKVALPGMKGRGLKGAIDMLAGLNLSDQQMIQALGRTEAFSAYVALRDNPELLASAITAQEEAVGTNLVQRILDVRQADPTFAAARNVRIERARADLSMETAGVQRMLSEAMIERKRAEHLAAGGSELIGWLGPALMRAQRYFGDPRMSGDEFIVRTFGTEAEAQRMREATAAARENLYPPIEVAERLDDAAKRLRSGPTLSHPDRDK